MLLAHSRPASPALPRQLWRRPQQRRVACRRRSVAPAEAAPGAGLPVAADDYADPLAQQRVELGARVMRHLAGLEPCPELDSAVKVLPVRVEPPRAWHTLEAGVREHGPAALSAALAPRHYPVPSWGSLAHCGCELASSRVGRRFRARPINLFLSLLFEAVPGAAALAGLPQVQLCRYDLHHGHLFWSEAGGGQLGLLLHCKEYPAACAERFPVHLGRCQDGSGLDFDEAAMDARNLVWLGGRLACLDVSQPALCPLLMPGLELPRTVLEHDMGQPLADVNYFHELAGRKPAERVFVCVPGMV